MTITIDTQLPGQSSGELAGQTKPVRDITTDTLDSVQALFDRFVAFPSDEARDAVVLWVAHTHVFSVFDATPRLSIRSKEPGSGKSRVLDVIEHLVPSPMNCAYLTPGVMWRKIEHGSPTILFDEADTVFGMNGSSSSHVELRGIINAGHRSNGSVPRCVGSEGIKEFRVFAPVALAGIGRLPETIATRSVEIVMKRAVGNVSLEKFRLRFVQGDLDTARAQLTQWGKLATKPLATVLPDLPVTERAADVWEPLVAIADLAGGEWSVRAREACEVLVAEAKEQPASPEAELLKSLREVFADEAVLATDDVLAGLYGLDESPYVPGFFGSRDLSRMLAAHGVKSQTIRVPGVEKPVRGYKRETLERVWSK